MEAIVLYPCPGMGHLLPMLELSKLIHTHNPSLFIHILINNPPVNLGSIASQIAEISITIPSITFHYLPSLSPPLNPSSFHSLQALIYKFLCLMAPHVQTTLQSLSLTFNVRAFVLDILCSPTAQAAAALFIPTYYFFTAGTSCLSLFLYFPTIHKRTTMSLKDSQDVLYIPSLPPVPSSHMPEPLLDRTTMAYAWFLDCMTHLPNSSGIIVNTFEEFESKAFRAISDGLCVPKELTPPIYCVGPLTQTGGGHGGSDSNNNTIKCLKWLNSQPSQSVIFLCFGSLGLFPKEQLTEIALGLEKSGQRFLWVVRNPVPDVGETEPDPDLSSLLPRGFLERTKERGMVVKSWAPQVAVLNHNSVGGFMTHCGWNSVLESVRAGVPMIAWPLYAEQKFNKIVVMEELKVALAMEESEGEGGVVVSATEVERRVRELMESDKGKWIRNKVVEIQSKALRSTTEDGSSWLALDQLIHAWTTA